MPPWTAKCGLGSLKFACSVAALAQLGIPGVGLAESPAISARSAALAVPDKGVFSDLDPQVRLRLPERATTAPVEAVWDTTRALLVLYVEAWPT